MIQGSVFWPTIVVVVTYNIFEKSMMGVGGLRAAGPKALSLKCLPTSGKNPNPIIRGQKLRGRLLKNVRTYIYVSDVAE